MKLHVLVRGLQVCSAFAIATTAMSLICADRADAQQYPRFQRYQEAPSVGPGVACSAPSPAGTVSFGPLVCYLETKICADRSNGGGILRYTYITHCTGVR